MPQAVNLEPRSLGVYTHHYLHLYLISCISTTLYSFLKLLILWQVPIPVYSVINAVVQKFSWEKSKYFCAVLRHFLAEWTYYESFWCRNDFQSLLHLLIKHSKVLRQRSCKKWVLATRTGSWVRGKQWRRNRMWNMQRQNLICGRSLQSLNVFLISKRLSPCRYLVKTEILSLVWWWGIYNHKDITNFPPFDENQVK